MGFADPVVIGGKHFLKQIINTNETTEIEWDEPLPANKLEEWNSWRTSLQSLSNLIVKRAFIDPSHVWNKELHIFADAADIAITAAAYLRCIDSDRQIQVSFAMEKSKLASSHGTTISRLELCSAAFDEELFDFIKEEIDMKIEGVFF